MDIKSIFRVLSNLKVQKKASFGKLSDASETVDVEGNIAVTGTVDGVDVSSLPNQIDSKANETVTITAGSGLSGGGDLSADFSIENADKGSTQSIFKEINVPNQNTIFAAENNDSFSLKSDNGLTLTTDDATNSIDLSVNDVLSFSAINFETSNSESVAEGKLFWDSNYGTLKLGLEGGNSSVKLGESLLVKVINTSSSSISKNNVVLVDNTSNGLPGVVKVSEGDTSKPILGITTEEIGIGQSGYVQTEGLVENINVNNLSSGSLLYVDYSTSLLTPQIPSGPNPQKIAGFVVQPTSDGSVYVEFDRGRNSLSTLEDVDYSVLPSDGDVLVYNATTSLWEPAVGPAQSQSLNDGENVVTAEEARLHIDDTNNPHGLTTDVIPEGETNKYASDSNVSEIVTKTFVENLNIDADTVDGNEASYLINRENHTGTQTSNTISDFSTAVENQITKTLINDLNVDADTLDGFDSEDFVKKTEVGSADGVASLGSDGKIPSSELPALSLNEVFVVETNIERDALTVQEGDIAQVTGTGLTFIYDGTSWVEITSASDVTSVNSYTGNVNLDTDDVSEGTTNKYYASSLFDSDFSGKTTDDLTEGVNNKYYSSELTNADIDERVNKAFVDALNVDADTLDGLDSTAFSEVGHTHETSDITDFSTAVQNEVDKTYVDNLNVDADTLDGKDSTDFSEVGHTHTSTEVTDFSTAVQSEIDKNYVDLLNVDADTLDGKDSTDFVFSSSVGSADGVAPLNESGLINESYLPDSIKTFVTEVSDLTERDSLTAQSGDLVKVLSNNLTYVYDGTGWTELTAASAVSSVNSQTGDVSLDTDDITEGTTNLYYSSSLANADIDARVDKDFVDALNVDASTLEGNDSTAFATSSQGNLADTAIQPGDDVNTLGSGSAQENQAALADGAGSVNWTSLDTSLVPEDASETNVYYTTSRFDSDFSLKTTDDLSEGSNNEYYTDAKVRTEIESTNLDLGSNNFTTTGQATFANSVSTITDLPDASTYPGVTFFVTSENSLYSSNGSTWFSVLDSSSATTDDVQEGTSSLYFTDTRVNTAIDNRLTPSYVSPLVFDDSQTNLWVDNNLGDDFTNSGLTFNSPLKTIKKAVEVAGNMIEEAASNPSLNVTGVTIKVAAGEYLESNPITVPARVSIVGDDLRNVRLFAENPRLDFFHVSSLNYLYGLRFMQLQSPAFAVAFPSAAAKATYDEAESTITDVELVYSPEGYGDVAPEVYVDPPDIGISDKIESIFLIDAGSGYDSNEPPAVVFSGGGDKVYVEAEAEAVVGVDGSISGIDIINPGKGYTEKPTISIEPPPDPGGNVATAEVLLDAGYSAVIEATVNEGLITGLTITDPGFGYTQNPFISIAAPVEKQPFIIGSPYIQNCSSITGPFDTNGNLIPVTVPLPYDETNVYNDELEEDKVVVDKEGAGGGMRIDGRVCYGYNNLTETFPTIPSASPLRSMVADAFTQVNQGGPGHLIINNGYAQFVSCFTTFCTYSFKAKNGGFANISNSVTDFGEFGLVSEGYQPEFYTNGFIQNTKTSTISAVDMLNQGSGYDAENPPSVSFSGGGAIVNATGTAIVDEGEVVGIVIDDGGDGYTGFPDIFIDPPPPGAENPEQASAEAVLSGVGTLELENVYIDEFSNTRRPDVGSVAFVSNTNVRVVNVIEENFGFSVSFFPSIPSIQAGEKVFFHQLSNLSTGSHVFEFPGSGVTYNSLPEYGGVPDSSREVVEARPGVVYYSSTDNIGNFKVGPFFSVEQATGVVTIDSDQFNLSGLNAIGPFKVQGVNYGVQLREVTNNTSLLADSGLNGNAVPTTFAVRQYIQDTINKPFIDDLNVDAGTLGGLSKNDFAQLNAVSNTFTGDVVIDGDLNSSTANSINLSASDTLTLSATNDVSITGDTSISGELSSTGSFSSKGITENSSDIALTIDSAGDATFNYDVTVSGDFTVNGTTTTISSENVAVSNTLFLLNDGQQTPLNDTGLLLQRYETTSPTDFNIGVVWEEGQDELVFGFTQNDASQPEVVFDESWLKLSSPGNAEISNNLQVDGSINASTDITIDDSPLIKRGTAIALTFVFS